MINPERYQQIDELFRAALEVEPDKRSEFISSACSGDEALQKEVEALIASASNEWSLIDQRVPELATLILPEQLPDLAVGETLGHYEILSLLGAGGMGRVYLAEDSRLSRKVALKLLPLEFTKNESRLRRFGQEARAASALNHPNILTIHDIAEINGRQLIATEFVDGETLRQRLNRAPLALPETLDIAIQVASALSAAHQAGIVHRDIKPENIMLRRDGYVKVLDFGLAKLTQQQETPTASGTVETVDVSSGLVMGTVKYMSPEQAQGLHVDQRSDIFSLGVVMYEMLTGHAPFQGETASDLISAIIGEEPLSPKHYAPRLADELQRVVIKALVKDKEARYQTTEEILSDLMRLKEESRAWGIEYLISQIKQHKARAALALSVIVVILAGVLFGLYKFFKAKNVTFQNINVTKLTTFGDARYPSISPDGKYVVYIKTEGLGKFSLWLRTVGTADEIQIVPPTEGAPTATTFSPDGKFISYRNNAPRAYLTMPITGGEATKLPLSGNGDFLFSPDGKRLTYLENRFAEGKTVLVVANADGTDEQDIFTRQAPTYYRTAIRPAWSPDGRMIACVGQNGNEGFVRVFAVNIDTRTEEPITTQKWNDILGVRWLPDSSGLLLAASEETSSSVQIWHVSYPSGYARRITNDTVNYFGLDLTADGKTLVTTKSEAPRSIWVMETEVKPSVDASISAFSVDSSRASQVNTTNLTGTSFAEGFGNLKWTPDGRLIYVSQESGNTDIWSMNADGSGRTQLTTDPHWDTGPDVSPDGRYIVFMSNRSGAESIWRMDIDGRNQIRLTSNLIEREPHFSADSKWVYFTCWETGRLAQCKVPVDGGQTIQVAQTELAIGSAMSPDGKLLLQLVRGKVHITPSDGGPPIKSFDQLGYSYQWTPDGKALTFLPTLNRTLLAALAKSPSINKVSNVWVQPLDGGEAMPLTNFSLPSVRAYAWSRDGRKLAVVRGNNTSDVVLINDIR